MPAHLPACFASLSAAELAHVARCQRVALERHLSVISAGVFATEASPALAGRFFWLVASPEAPAAVALVWREGSRLQCGCKRRKSDRALTCCHAQTVRLFLLAAAGAPVPPPDPDPDPAPTDPAPDGAPQGVPEVEPVAPCPGCGELAPVETIAALSLCVECRDLEAEAAAELEARRSAAAERIPHCVKCGLRAVGETADGPLCAAHLARACADCGQPITGERARGATNSTYCGPCRAKRLAFYGPDSAERLGVAEIPA